MGKREGIRIYRVTFGTFLKPHQKGRKKRKKGISRHYHPAHCLSPVVARKKIKQIYSVARSVSLIPSHHKLPTHTRPGIHREEAGSHRSSSPPSPCRPLLCGFMCQRFEMLTTAKSEPLKSLMHDEWVLGQHLKIYAFASP